MPPVVAVVIAIAKVAIVVAKVVSVVASVASFFIKPKAPSFGSGAGSGARGNSGLSLMVKESDYPRRIIYGKARVGGIWYYVETVGIDNSDVWLVLGICDGVTKGPRSMYFGDDLIDIEIFATDVNGVDVYRPVDDEARGGKYKDNVEVTFHRGDQLQADARLVEASAVNWTESCKLLGISYAVVKLTYDSVLFPEGVPQISFLWEGVANIFDPRDGTSSYTNNAMLCINNYMTLSRVGPNADYVTEMDETSIMATASVCDEQVATLSGTEPRYTCDGVIFLSQTPEANIAALLTSMGGFSSYAGGRFTFGAAAWREATFELTIDHIERIERYSNRVPKRSRVNTVKGLFISEVNLFQSSDFPTRTKQSYIEADGEELILDLDLQFTESPSRAQRLASIELEDRRLQKTLQVECSLEAFRAQAGKNILVTIERYGLSKVPFFVESFTFTVGAEGNLLVSLTLKETSASVYDWGVVDELPVQVAPVLANDGLKVSSIVATPPAGEYLTSDFPLEVELATLTDDAGIRWSKSFVPENVGSANEFTGTVTVYENDPLFARAFRDDYADSDIFIGVYAVEQVERATLSPAGGSYPLIDFPISVSASTTTPAAFIRWSKSSEPTSATSGTEYTGPVDVQDGETLFVKAFKTGLVDSEGTSETYVSS